MKNDDKLITLDQAKFLKSIGFREKTIKAFYIDPTSNKITQINKFLSTNPNIVYNDRPWFYSRITIKEYRSYLLKLRLDMLKEINDTFK